MRAENGDNQRNESHSKALLMYDAAAAWHKESLTSLLVIESSKSACARGRLSSCIFMMVSVKMSLFCDALYNCFMSLMHVKKSNLEPEDCFGVGDALPSLDNDPSWFQLGPSCG